MLGGESREGKKGLPVFTKLYDGNNNNNNNNNYPSVNFYIKKIYLAHYYDGWNNSMALMVSVGLAGFVRTCQFASW